MNFNWTFGRKIAAGFIVSSILLVAIGTVSYLSINKLIVTNFWVAHTHKVLEEISNLSGSLQEAETGFRGYALTGNPTFLEPYEASREEFPRLLKGLKDLTSDNPDQQKLLDQVSILAGEKFAGQKENISNIENGHTDIALKTVATGGGKKLMDNLRRTFSQMEDNESALLKKRNEEAEATIRNAQSTIIYGTLLCLVFVTIAGYLITRALSTQIGAAVGHVQSSSAELQAAASQQASGAKEQATAMSEISTTISELVATSRQIAESAQRVAVIAEQNAAAARNGDVKVDNGQDSMSAIRRQVDLVVSHMLDLGRKSQEIGAVLDIVSELAE
ncbi:CHASE3 domain-containing protein, partial [Undibacterium sp.]|uniref:CHASE3 domain-containing protein n=1 Tax=Undibacterium sp. TaxID=1914977 RepID=UPI00374DAD61